MKDSSINTVDGWVGSSGWFSLIVIELMGSSDEVGL